MSHEISLSLVTFDALPLTTFRLGVIGYNARAGAYVSRASALRRSSGPNFETIVFVAPDSPGWNDARSAAAGHGYLAVCTSAVTAILPTEPIDESEARFVVETAHGSYAVHDLFLSQSGYALLPDCGNRNFKRDA